MEGYTVMQKILIIGAAILDILVRPADASVFETGSHPAEDICMSLGGDALNEALVLSSLGKNVRLETVVGEDCAGRFIIEQCRERGIVIEQRQIRKIPTGINVVLVGKDGERSFLTNPNGTLRGLVPGDIRMPFDSETDILCFASIFVFPQIKAEHLVQIFSQAKKQGITVCADMTKRKCGETAQDMQEALSYVDYLFANEEEACLLTGETDMKKAAQMLLSCKTRHVIIKCGARGCFVSSEKESYMVPAEKGTVCIDTTGAGDSFTAGFLCALSEGKGLYECARFANKCGAKAVGALGGAAWASRPA